MMGSFFRDLEVGSKILSSDVLELGTDSIGLKITGSRSIYLITGAATYFAEGGTSRLLKFKLTLFSFSINLRLFS